ncbi:hypothetical protein L2E82_39485 [Cichorium intybus]|uniref:Uncharacterized protein n=1 Tax=Cichorium intybus TaxID=13427 RepID=A0ACB9AJC4_CICIN|nr:hypothetical protein L2E82_39485 [Cichorium intybus]
MTRVIGIESGGTTEYRTALPLIRGMLKSAQRSMELLCAFSFIPENLPRVMDVLTEAAEGYRFNGNKFVTIDNITGTWKLLIQK